MMKDELTQETLDWSESFKRLYALFAQINTHLTFLASHSMATIPSFDLIRKLNADVTVLDLEIIKCMFASEEIFFDYVDENEVMLSFAEKLKFDWSKGYTQSKPVLMDQAFEDVSGSDDHQHGTKQLLIFDFRDTKIHGIGAALKGSKRRKPNLKQEESLRFFFSSKELYLAKLTPVQLLRIVNSRNKKFKDAINSHLKKFTSQEILEDIPMTNLISSSEPLMPTPPSFDDPVDLLSQKDSLSIKTEVKSDIDQMIGALKDEHSYKNQIVSIETLNRSQHAKLKPLSSIKLIHPDLIYGLIKYRGISLDRDLYVHQALALDALINDERRKNVIVSTSTSSGKSLIYQLPIINDILWLIENGSMERLNTAFFIFPTKALAQDQKRHLQEFIACIPICNERKILVETYDGDTDQNLRNFVRSFADIVFTNPDALHASILPNYDKSHRGKQWIDFLSNLKYVVMDELHVYQGTFGIHVSYVMSRLLRLISKITETENNITFISCSATIQNPVTHFRSVCSISCDDEIVHISEDGAPCCEKKLLIWNPPPLMNKKGQQYTLTSSSQLGESLNNTILVPRESIISELAKILLRLLGKLPDVKAIVFCPIRKVCELLMKEIRSLLKDEPFRGCGLNEDDILSYRGGYAKHDRRVIEGKMFDGQVRAIVATNALELGIDLSDIDIVMSCGFPMLKLNLHQQFGRAGRGKNSKGSLAIYVAGTTPVDQYFLKNTKELCNKTYEDLCVDGLMEFGTDQLIMDLHLQCAAFEWPIEIQEDMKWFCPDNSINKMNTFTKLCKEKLYQDNDNYYRTHPKFLPWPTDHVQLRAIENDNFAVVDITNDRNIVIEEVEASRTSFTLYEGAIFLHQGYPYLVKEFNSDYRFAKVERVNVDWITLQRDFTDIDPTEIILVKQLFPTNSSAPIDIPVYFGRIEMTIIVFGYFKVNRRSEILEAVEVKNPPIVLNAKGFWIDIPLEALRIIKEKHLSAAGGIHSAQHAIMNILPLYISGGATTDPNAKFSSRVGEAELMTECKAPEKEFAQRETKRKRPGRLIFYDCKGGERGSGISAKTFEHIDDILFTTYQRVRDCKCEYGCPECVAASFCKEMMLVMSKPAAIIILASLLGINLNELREQIADGPEPNMPKLKVETIESVGGPVKFSKDVEILETRRATSPLSSLVNHSIKLEEDQKVK
ncbi:uncharacterized protein PRCAT00001552001 [Priceomyces carsonii]|uniref:uncharacterized protein n=1 Tax=Priceomyces carsonii TaxID=28549 RepID=UPI002ED9BB9C|nr:unnamed protein product [Priceomyces carsonii]